ncbi:UDP-N-acetylmuramate:L-alanyl-gamma-D-glutamyl-meso-diaminopimelate ligase [Desulfurivibrio dismutans]|uniref:UDP-N-acetylmuramate:L-alanyl-gamma-D-glutamyl- meso-diaminopimelate ligase n=1 Tax=Desulfurivibrio dismutans TaxID=1398908 RepID=UPI0023DA72C4|nr:UDP-N-acetylmuramate:L-alanyl-gamma-D-glutamyl-meso-diaminopimelate ligase [Desulfurivibrio alkaliphilus]MDF1614014.1 UDP-N-acetylmuramate:L-alanyl-gamma-D-glutamyl-meso-diaminopimelate ligase [Desulfurivibrio alkaliphilus]
MSSVAHAAAGPSLDPALNCPPPGVRHVHLMGIGGTGMAALAGMLQEAGWQVSGSDRKVYPPMSDYLVRLGIPVMEGYGPQNLAAGPDLVIVGNVIRADNPEARELARRRLPYLSFPQALRHYFLANRRSLVVAGTHGKTTTSSLLATLLDHAGLDPGFMVGGIVQAFGRSSRAGSGHFFVSEGDEYDTAFFDKGPKFLHYCPEVCILTGVEFDHADIYPDLAAVKASFARLVALMPPAGRLVAWVDDPVVRELVAAAPCPVLGYGESQTAGWRMRDLAISPEGTRFTVERDGAHFGDFFSRMPGRHNALNALAVIAVLDHLGVASATMAAGLAAFVGVRRRQEVRGVAAGVTVIDDFAHHPTAVRETLSALKAAYPGRRLVAVFEPRTNSSRRSVFQEAYVPVFAAADRVLLREPEGLEAIPVGERFSVTRLAADLAATGRQAQAFGDVQAIIDELATSVRPGDVVAILSNGGFDNIHQRLLDQLRQLPGSAVFSE